jgi:hypothetical protein
MLKGSNVRGPRNVELRSIPPIRTDAHHSTGANAGPIASDSPQTFRGVMPPDTAEDQANRIDKVSLALFLMILVLIYLLIF